jgi:aldehyde dehydrogenase (NAD+)
MAYTNELLALQNYFKNGETKSYSFRLTQLKKLKQSILNHEDDLYNALNVDLKKSKEETWVTETGMVLSELNAAIKHLKSWMEPERVGTNLLNMPSSSKIIPEPLGVVLIIGPWNYPFQLLINPLIGAIAAGNCIVVKASEFAPATAAIMKKIIEESFAKNYILFVDGDGATVVTAMLNNFTFDHIFYTGSTAVGKLIYKMAAENLTPVTLELGGKSPCVVEEDANIKVAARRIAVTKYSNCGQMCVAPDYVLVHESKKNELVEAIKKAIISFFSEDAATHYNYGKIINEKQFDRLSKYLQQGNILFGGKTNKEKLFIEPTIIDTITLDDSIMKDEIFGPILPIISYKTKEEALAIIEKNKNPLAFYVFTSNKSNEKFWIDNVAFGGGCVNNASWHLTNHNLPFGGRGFSGTGNYHGKNSFDTFSHKKAVMKTPTWFDPSIKYPPFKGKLNLFKWVIK